MASILVVFDSGQGQTANVAEHVRWVLAERGHDVTVRHALNQGDVRVDDFDAVLVGSPVHYRRHLPAVVEFVAANREALAARPSGFFQVSLAPLADADWVERAEAAFVDSLVDETGWQPDEVGSFAGAVTYSQYSLLTRGLFRLISLLTTGDTDTSRDYVYTDWDAVQAFATGFAERVEAEAGKAPAAAPNEALPESGRTRAAASAAVLVAVTALAYWLVVRRELVASE